MILKGPFQHKPFYNSMIVRYKETIRRHIGEEINFSSFHQNDKIA